MNYRAHLIGATLEMQRRPNGGTRVALSIPKNDRTAMGEGA
jgi:nitrate/nitrite-specific signal transduction histidine kinase